MPIKMTFSLTNNLGQFQKRSVTDDLASELKESFTDAITVIKNKAVDAAPTTRIANNIETQIESKRYGNYALELIGKLFVRLDEDHAPEARAYEYGSGIHSTKGPKTKYSIDAKNVPNLVFFWKNRNKMFVGPHVNHPGVEAQPYLRPAIDANLPNLREMNRVRAINVIRNFFRR